LELQNVASSADQTLNSTQQSKTKQSTEKEFLSSVENVANKTEANITSSKFSEENVNTDLFGQENNNFSTTVKYIDTFFGLPVNDTSEKITTLPDEQRIISGSDLSFAENFSISSFVLTTLSSIDSRESGHQITQKLGQPEDENSKEKHELQTEELVHKVGEISFKNEWSNQALPTKKEEKEEEGIVEWISDLNGSSTSSNKESSTDQTIKITTLSEQTATSAMKENIDSASGFNNNFNLTTLGTLKTDRFSSQQPEDQISSSTSSQTDTPILKFTILEAEEFTTVMSRVFDQSTFFSGSNPESTEIITKEIPSDSIQASVLDKDKNEQTKTSTLRSKQGDETSVNLDENPDSDIDSTTQTAWPLKENNKHESSREEHTTRQVETVNKQSSDSIIVNTTNIETTLEEEKSNETDMEPDKTKMTESIFSATLTNSFPESTSVESVTTRSTTQDTENKNVTSSGSDLSAKSTEQYKDSSDKASYSENSFTTPQPVMNKTKNIQKQTTFEQDETTQEPGQISELGNKKKNETSEPSLTTLNWGSDNQSNFSTTTNVKAEVSKTQESELDPNTGITDFEQASTPSNIQFLHQNTDQSTESNFNLKDALNTEKVAFSDWPILSSTTLEQIQFLTTVNPPQFTAKIESTLKPATEQSVIITSQSFQEAFDETKILKAATAELIVSSTTSIPDEEKFQKVPLIIPAKKEDLSNNGFNDIEERKESYNLTIEGGKQKLKEPSATDSVSEQEDFENADKSQTTEKQASLSIDQLKQQSEKKENKESAILEVESDFTTETNIFLNQTQIAVSQDLNVTSTKETQNDPKLTVAHTENATSIKIHNSNMSSDITEDQTNLDILASSGSTEDHDNHSEETSTSIIGNGNSVKTQLMISDSELLITTSATKVSAVPITIMDSTEPFDVFEEHTDLDILASSGITEDHEDIHSVESSTSITGNGSSVKTQLMGSDSKVSITTTATEISNNIIKEEATTLPIVIFKSPQSEPSLSSSDSPSSTSTETTTPPAEESFLSSGLFERVRDILLTLAAGLMTQAISFPVLPSRRGDAAEPPSRFSQTPIIRDPSIRKKIQEENFSFSGNTINLTIPIQPNELDNLRDDTLRRNLTNFATDTFKAGDVVHDVGIILDENEKDGRIIITAQRDQQTNPEDQNNFSLVNQDEQPQTISTTSRPIITLSFDENVSESIDQFDESSRPVPQTDGKLRPEQSTHTGADEQNEGANEPVTNQVFREQQLSSSEQTPAFLTGSTFPTTARQQQQNLQTESPTRIFASTSGGLNEIKFDLGDAITRPSITVTSTGSSLGVTTTLRTPSSSILTTTTSRNISREESSDSILRTTLRNTTTTIDLNDLTSATSDRSRINDKFNPELSYPQPPQFSNNGINETQEYEEDESSAPALPVFNDEEFFGAVSSDDDRFFDSRINILGGSSANIVQATVVEDLNFARSVRDSSIGIATISSITVGVIALLGFGLLIFLALARRRRMRRQGTSSMGSPMVTPTQSRTTFSGSPIMGDTPSLSDTRAASYLDDPINTSSSAGSSLDPVLPLDGHGTIVTSYDDYMSLPENARSNIFSSLAGSGSGMGSAAGPSPPPPPLAVSESVPRTRDLTESSDFLFSRSPPPYNPYPV